VLRFDEQRETISQQLSGVTSLCYTAAVNMLRERFAAHGASNMIRTPFRAKEF
jgi:hypothetical protein